MRQLAPVDAPVATFRFKAPAPLTGRRHCPCLDLGDCADCLAGLQGRFRAAFSPVDRRGGCCLGAGSADEGLSTGPGRWEPAETKALAGMRGGAGREGLSLRRCSIAPRHPQAASAGVAAWSRPGALRPLRSVKSTSSAAPGRRSVSRCHQVMPRPAHCGLFAARAHQYALSDSRRGATAHAPRRFAGAPWDRYPQGRDGDAGSGSEASRVRSAGHGRGAQSCSCSHFALVG